MCVYYILYILQSTKRCGRSQPIKFQLRFPAPSGPLSTAQPSWKKFGDGVTVIAVLWAGDKLLSQSELTKKNLKAGQHPQKMEDYGGKTNLGHWLY
jgi:hypothetical protein